MLDSETKRRIDTARDILVGKVPDPKSQVEQITIALIYKFMDDMDAEAEELGGVRSFFVGEYEKFSWAKLLSPALGGYEMLSLYTEAVEKMTRNQGIPQLFRDIFKNAYLPYRDPETLKMFLKVINDFNYEHSEKLGDAFEYLLSVLGSQGDAGQFRTPRHIIDFMVKVVDPKKDDSILDPACGTAGFLISAYKHVMAYNEKDGKPGGDLKPEERLKLANNIRGYDISPDMVRLSLVNLYLHGFTTPNIFEYDTLTSDERWNEYADVILANPPFMSPKGGIKPHKRFSVQSNRSEVLFVDYMAEHLTPNGRAAIIVPEGIIFQSAGAYKQLRKYLIESNYLWAVVSLPAGVFNPYAGVKTSILFLDKALAKKTDQILFVKIEADGFDLGAQRRPIYRNDLPEALKVLKEYKQTLKISEAIRVSEMETLRVLTVPISKLAEIGDFNLSAERYREVTRSQKQKYQIVKIKEIFDVQRGASPRPIDKYITEDPDGVNWIKIGDGSSTSMYISSTKEKIIQEAAKKLRWVNKGDLILSNSMSIGHPYIMETEGCIHDGWLALRPKSEDLIKEFFYHILGSDQLLDQFKRLATGGVVNNLNSDRVRNVEIPLPPLEIQRQIVDEIAAHQVIIDGARQVVKGWKYDIENEPFDKSQKTKVEDFVTIQGGYAFKSEWFSNGGIRLVRNTNIGHGSIRWDETAFLPIERRSEFYDFELHTGDILITLDRPIISTGLKIALVTGKDIPSLLVQRVGRAVFINTRVLPKFFWAWLNSPYFISAIDPGRSITVPHISPKEIENIPFSPPPLDIQSEIVARIEREHAIVEGNRELIRLYEEKIKKVIERVWEG